MSVINIDDVEQQARELAMKHYPVQDLDGFMDSATYVNEILPQLREIAQYDGESKEIEFTADDLDGTTTGRSSAVYASAVGAFLREVHE